MRDSLIKAERASPLGGHWTLEVERSFVLPAWLARKSKSEGKCLLYHTNSKSLIPFHFPVSGSRMTLCAAVPYRAGAFGLSICNGLPPRTPRGTAPCTPRSEMGGGGATFLLPFGPAGALKVCADAVAASAATSIMLKISSFFIILSHGPKRASSCRLRCLGPQL